MWIFQPRLTEGIAVTVLKTVSLQNFCNEQNTTWFCNFILSQHKAVKQFGQINLTVLCWFYSQRPKHHPRVKQAIFSVAAAQFVLPRTNFATGMLTAQMEKMKKTAVSTIPGSWSLWQTETEILCRTSWLIGPEKQFLNCDSFVAKSSFFKHLPDIRKGKITGKFQSLNRVLVK